MPFKYFLTTSLDFERTHQLILQCLLNDPAFLKLVTGLNIDKYFVKLEPVRGLFDIGILNEKKQAICLIELKMWSALSQTQLDKQLNYLVQKQCRGIHILLGTSDI